MIILQMEIYFNAGRGSGRPQKMEVSETKLKQQVVSATNLVPNQRFHATPAACICIYTLIYHKNNNDDYEDKL